MAVQVRAVQVVSGCPTSVGCSVDLGRCSESGESCSLNSDCSGSENVCEGANCTGSPACSQFETESYCDGSNGYDGCSWNETVANNDDNASCEEDGGIWTCGESTEICNNGVDDDGDGLVDCMDPACQQG